MGMLGAMMMGGSSAPPLGGYGDAPRRRAPKYVPSQACQDEKILRAAQKRARKLRAKGLPIPEDVQEILDSADPIEEEVA